MPLYGLNKSQKQFISDLYKSGVDLTKDRDQGEEAARANSNDVVHVFNETGKVIPRYGLVFCTGYKSFTGVDGIKIMTVKSYQQIVGTPEEEAKKFPVINDEDPIQPDQIGTITNRDGLWIVQYSGGNIEIGSQVGPIDSTDADKEFAVKKDSDDPLFQVIGSFDGDGFPAGDYVTVNKLSTPGDPEIIRFVNKSTQTIQPYGVAFATDVVPNEDGSAWLVEVKAWNEIKTGSKRFALPFAIINGSSPVAPDETGSTLNRDGYWIVEVESSTVVLGGLIGPYDESEASKKFVLSRDSKEKIFETVDRIDASLFGGDPSKYYALVKLRDKNESASKNNWATGVVTALGDFPGGRSGTGGGTLFGGVYPASITVSPRAMWGDEPASGNFTAYYFGSFPIAVGAEVICLHTGYNNTTPLDGTNWWVIDAQRWELPSRPGG